MNYKKIVAPITLMKCDWVQHGVDDKGGPTYKKSEFSYLLVQFFMHAGNIHMTHLYCISKSKRFSMSNKRAMDSGVLYYTLIQGPKGLKFVTERSS